MFGFFKKKKKGTGELPQDKQNDDAEFYQAVVNKFVTMLDAHVDANPDMPEFRDRWMFKLEEISAWNQTETLARMSCKVVAVDMNEELPSFGEWAHGFGDDMESAFNLGFANWIETDLPVLVDVIQDKSVLSLEMKFEWEDGSKPVRGILGPMQFWSKGDNAPEPCCDVCIFREAMDRSKDLLEELERPFLIKAVVARNEDNTTSSDFRVNDVQHDVIAAHLCEWAKDWDGEGFAMRKQSMLFIDA